MARLPKVILKDFESGKAGVLVVDGQPIVRERLVEIIASQSDCVSCGETDNSRSAFDLISSCRVDLVVTSLSLKDSHGLEFIKDLHVRYPQLQVLVFSMHDESLYAERSIRAGASGFVSKQEKTSELLRAIRHVLAGEIHLSDRIAGPVMRRHFSRTSRASGSDLEQLSDRELEIFELIGRGRSSRQIAESLHIHLKTVETYRCRIKTKLRLSGAPELARRALQSVEELVSSRRSQ
ncbi:MAG: response regulator [Chthoniobacterales bacterium]